MYKTSNKTNKMWLPNNGELSKQSNLSTAITFRILLQLPWFLHRNAGLDLYFAPVPVVLPFYTMQASYKTSNELLTQQTKRRKRKGNAIIIQASSFAILYRRIFVLLLKGINCPVLCPRYRNEACSLWLVIRTI